MTWIAMAALVLAVGLPGASRAEIVTVEFEGIVSDPPTCPAGVSQVLADELAQPGQGVRGLFEYDTEAVPTRIGGQGQRIYDLDLPRLVVRFSLGPRETFDRGEYFVVVHEGLALGGERPRGAGFEARRSDASGWPGDASMISYGIILQGGPAEVAAWPSLPNGFDGSAFRRARWSVEGRVPRGNLSTSLWRLCGSITSLSAPRSSRPSRAGR